jgi:hypothetical protein
VLIDDIPVVDHNALKFRVEVFSWSEHEFFCQVSRMDLYRVKPTFYDAPADEHFLVLDDWIEWRDLADPPV